MFQRKKEVKTEASGEDTAAPKNNSTEAVENKTVSTNEVTVEVYKRRACDFEKKSSKSLVKNYSVFTSAKTEGQRFGCSEERDYGPHLKTKKNKSKKLYYLSLRQVTVPLKQIPEEYFALEILNYLGINTPKARITSNVIAEAKEPRVEYITATEAILNFIPLSAFSPYYDESYQYAAGYEPDRKLWVALRERYHFDCENQIFLDKQTNQKCKINHNMFGAHILAALIGDFDFGFHNANCGFVRKGNRFYAVAIDKEAARFEGQTYEYLVNLTSGAFTDPIFESSTQDQILAIINRLEIGLKRSVFVKRSDFEKIFLNPRVLATEDLAVVCKTFFENFTITANSFIDHYKKVYGQDCLKEFTARENIRQQIAVKVIAELKLPNEFLEIIIEDLRAPYYQIYFKNKTQISKDDADNSELLKAIIADLRVELNLTIIEEPKKSVTIAGPGKP